MSPKRLILLSILLLSVLAAGSAMAGEEEAPVSISEVTGVSNVTGVSDICSETTCSTQADLTEGGAVLEASQTHNVVLDPDDETLLVATASGSVDARGVAPGLPEGATAAFTLRLVTTVPVMLEVSGSVGSQDGALGLFGVGGTHFDGDHIVAVDNVDGVSAQGAFSAVIPAGAINIGGSIRPHQLSQHGGEGSASFSVTVTITRAPGEIRWVNAAGGSWDDEANWDPEQVPGEGDRTVFDLNSTYAVNFPVAAAATSLASRGVETCASPRSVESTRVRAGTLTYTGAVDVSTLSDSVDDPGLRIGGTANFDDPEVILESGELCSLFSTVGDTDVVGTAAVTVQGGVWKNPGRLRVGDSGDGQVTITGGSVIAGETRIGNTVGGVIQVDGASADLDTGALLLGAPGMLGSAALSVTAGSARSDSALIGARLSVCLDASGRATDVPCATLLDCDHLTDSRGCQGTHSVEISGGGEWSAFDPVLVGGGTLVADDGSEFSVSGNGLLQVYPDSRASVAELSLGTHDRATGDTPATVSRGVAIVSGTLDVLGPMRVGDGGAGQLEIEPGGRVEVTGTTIVGRGDGGNPPLLAQDPFVPSARFRHGVVRIGGPNTLVLSGESLLRTPRLFVRDSGVIELDEGVIEATEQIRILSGGQLTGTGTVVTPDFDVASNGRLGPVFPVVVNARGSGTPAGLTIGGDLTLEPGAALEIAAVGPGECGKLHVTGDATLEGTLELVFPDGYLPGTGDVCEVLSVDGTTTGGFERIVARGVAEGFVYETTTAPDGSIRFEALSAATACAGGDTDGDGIADCERCDNCVDDTGNGLVDREDPDCTQPADGDGAGLASAAEAQAAVRCHGALRGATKLLATKTWKPLQKCADAMLKCRQRKPDDASCAEKVAAKCAKAAVKLAGEKGPAAKAEAKILQACSAVPIDALKDAAGLGHAAAQGACAAVGVPALATAADISACTTRRQQCQVGGLFGAVVPRAAELLGDAGIAPSVPCLAAGSDGGGLGLGDPKGAGKRAASCQKALGKAAGKLLSRALDAGGRCEGAVLGCVQGGDGSCLTRAASSCAKEQSKLAAAEDSLLGAIERKCGEKKGSPLVSAEDLLAPAGLGFDGATTRCAALGIDPLDSRAAVGACLVAENQCRERQVREAATPRNLELLTLGGVR